MVQPQRILIVDDHPVVRRGLRAMLAGESWVEKVYEAATVADAVREAVSHQVNVIAMDITLPDGDGIDATMTIRRRCPQVQVLILTLANDEETVARALRAGARGYVLKDTDPDTVVDSLRTVAGGGLVMGPKIGSPFLVGQQRAPADLPPPFDRLTTRERDIVRLLADGASNAEIAKELGVSEKTVRNQLSAVFSKIRVSDRTQAALLAQKNGIGAEPSRSRRKVPG